MHNRHKLLTAAFASLLMLGLSVPATALESPITAVKNSSEFEWLYEFEGDTADLLDALDLDGNGESDFSGYHANGVNSVQDGVMSTASTPDSGYNIFGTMGEGYQQVESTLWRWIGFDRTTGFTIEARLKVTSADPFTEGPCGATSLVAAPENSGATGGISIGSNGQYWRTLAENPIGPQEDNTDDFHTFRMALETSPVPATEKYSVWRDGVLISTGQAWISNGNTFSFGDGAGAISGSCDIDYLRIGHGSWAPWAALGIPGDANLDGVVDADDAAVLAGNWLASVGTWAGGDFNGDGVVDGIDATLLAANWQGAGASASVPEPSSLILMLSILSVAAFYRRAR